MSYYIYMDAIRQLVSTGLYNRQFNNVALHCLAPIRPIQNQQEVSQSLSKEEDSYPEDEMDVRSLFCANLDQNVTEELLYELFLQAGPIQKVYIPKNNNGKRRSYGFVTYKYCSTPSYAIKLYYGAVLFGKRLDIKSQRKDNVA